MAISATLQIWEANTGNVITQNMKDTYTVLNLDYTVERDCDKTGRPSGGASISAITVTIRANKEKGAPFHEWIQSADKLMDGVVKIYDSSGMVSSIFQDDSDADNKEEDVPDDMKEESKSNATDNASDDDHDQDMFDEMSHEDLVEYAQDHGINCDSNDSDEDLRKKIRAQESTKKAQGTDQAASSEPTMADQVKSRATSGAKSVGAEIAKRALECARSIAFENAYLISLKESFVNNPDSKGELDSDYPWTLELGIKPKTLKVTGEQLGTKALGGETKFDLY